MPKNKITNTKQNKGEKRKLLSPKLDVVFQVLFGEKGSENITKKILKAILKEPINKVDLSRNPILRRQKIKGKMGVLDVIAELNEKEMCDIEMQVGEQENIIKRILYYWARVYGSNINKKEDYEVLKRTIAILIADFEIPGLKELGYYTDWKLIETESRKVILTDTIEIVIIELPKIYRLKEEEQDKELLDWLYFLEDPNSKRVMDAMKENEGIREAREKLEEMSNDVIMQRLAEYRESAIIEENEARNTALHKGIAQGREEGLKEGLEQGEKKKQYEIAKKLKNKGIAIEEIMEITDLPKEEVEKL